MWRIRHKPTGLYYCPCYQIHVRGAGSKTKTNLSVEGKRYVSKPTLKKMGDEIYTHIVGMGGPNGECVWYNTCPIVETDWEIVDDTDTLSPAEQEAAEYRAVLNRISAMIPRDMLSGFSPQALLGNMIMFHDMIETVLTQYPASSDDE